MFEEDVRDNIDFDEFESPYFKVLEEPQDVVIDSWTTATTEIQGKRVRGILTRVTAINGKSVQKEFFMSSKRLIQAMRPFIEKAQKAGDESISVRVFKQGTGFQTSYTVRGV